VLLTAGYEFNTHNCFLLVGYIQLISQQRFTKVPLSLPGWVLGYNNIWSGSRNQNYLLFFSQNSDICITSAFLVVSVNKPLR